MSEKCKDIGRSRRSFVPSTRCFMPMMQSIRDCKSLHDHLGLPTQLDIMDPQLWKGLRHLQQLQDLCFQEMRAKCLKPSLVFSSCGSPWQSAYYDAFREDTDEPSAVSNLRGQQPILPESHSTNSRQRKHARNTTIIVPQLIFLHCFLSSILLPRDPPKNVFCFTRET